MKKLNKIILSIALVFVLAVPMLAGCSFGSSQEETYTITVVSNDSSKGYVYGSGTYAADEQITIVAVAKSGYVFDKWSDNNISPIRHNIQVTSDKTYTAYFKSDKKYRFSSANLKVDIISKTLPEGSYTSDDVADDYWLENISVKTGDSYIVNLGAEHKVGLVFDQSTHYGYMRTPQIYTICPSEDFIFSEYDIKAFSVNATVRAVKRNISYDSSNERYVIDYSYGGLASIDNQIINVNFGNMEYVAFSTMANSTGATYKFKITVTIRFEEVEM